MGAAAVGDSGDGQRRVGPDGAGQQRPVPHVQAGIPNTSPYSSTRPRPVPAHGGPAEGMDRDHPPAQPQRVVVERAPRWDATALMVLRTPSK